MCECSFNKKTDKEETKDDKLENIIIGSTLAGIIAGVMIVTLTKK